MNETFFFMCELLPVCEDELNVMFKMSDHNNKDNKYALSAVQ